MAQPKLHSVERMLVFVIMALPIEIRNFAQNRLPTCEEAVCQYKHEVMMVNVFIYL